MIVRRKLVIICKTGELFGGEDGPGLKAGCGGAGFRGLEGPCSLRCDEGQPGGSGLLSHPFHNDAVKWMGHTNYFQFLVRDGHQRLNFLFRLRKLRNNCGNLIECLVPALELTAVSRALHGVISNEGQFCLAVSQILKEGHVVRTVYDLMFYS